MIKNRLKYISFAVLIISILTLFFYLRMTKPKQLQQNVYQEWFAKFIGVLEDKTYIKTEETPEGQVTLSEAQGYGMLIAVRAAQDKLASKKDFDLLYQYYLDNRLPDSQLMSWKQVIKENGEIETFNHNATDGDLYIAYALMEAAKIWPKEAKIYHAQARAILKDILMHNYNPDLTILTVGDWANQDSKFHSLMRTSDVMPQQFEEFYQLTKDDTWLKLKDSMLDKLVLMSSKHQTGLVPDFMWIQTDDVRAAQANAVATEFDGTYSYNACRVPYHLAQDQDDRSQALLTKMLNFFMSTKRITAGYELSGKEVHTYQAASFLAPVFYAAQQTPGYDKLIQQNKFIFMQDLSKESYYEMALLTMVALEVL